MVMCVIEMMASMMMAFPVLHHDGTKAVDLLPSLKMACLIFGRFFPSIRSLGHDHYAPQLLHSSAVRCDTEAPSSAVTMDFPTNCSKSAAKSRRRRYLFFWLDAMLKILSGFLCTTAGLMGGIFGWPVGVALGGAGTCLTVFNFVAGWDHLHEKYAHLEVDFQQLALSTAPDRDAQYARLWLIYAHPTLASDFKPS